MEVRICACPGRDRRAEEKQAMPADARPSPKRPNKVTIGQEITTVGPSPKRRKGEEEVYTLTVSLLKNPPGGWGVEVRKT